MSYRIWLVLLLMGCIPPTLPGQTDEPEVENGAQPFERSTWIAAGPEAPAFDTTYPAPYFRKVFAVTAPVTRATAYVTAGGYFNLFLNGERVSDRYLDPAVTRYDKSVQYVTFDLTNSLAKGDNAIGVVLANGFYNVDTESAWQFDRAPWRNRPALRFVLHLEYADGRRQVIGSDASWRQITGPITFDQLRNGEYYDSRLRLGDWASPDYPDDDWSPAVAVTGPAGKLVPQRMPGIRKTRTLRPVAITEPEPGIYVVDFGQNIAGWARLTIDEEAGREVRMTYGERVYENGRLDIEELSRFIKTGETQTTRYLADGSGPREYEPSTTYFGFQYVEIEGLSAPPTEESIRAFMVHTALDTIGSFSTSDTLLNRIHENIRWSYLGNFHSFPEDCPHREKMGWTGDAQLVIETGLFNFDVQSAFVKWLGDFRDEQPASGALPGILPTSGWGYEMGHGKQPYYGPHWEGAAITIPWQVYRWRGDTAILRTNYPMMRRYLDFLDGQTEGNLLTGGIDDHKSIKTHTEGHYLSSAYYHWMLGIGADIAGVLDESDDATLLRQRARSVIEAFNRKYYFPESRTYGNGGQTQLAVVLGCNLVPDTRYAEVLTELITAIEKNDYHFDAGVIGVKKVIEVLLKNDRPDILHKLASQTGFPSFGYWIELGANTMWQNWDGSQSRNHIMFGSIGDYFYQGLAGIRPVTTAPGFREVDLRPYFPEDMRFLEASHHTPHGWLRTSWQREIDRITYTVTVPEGARASLAVPNGFRLESGPERSLRLPAGEHEVMLIQLK